MKKMVKFIIETNYYVLIFMKEHVPEKFVFDKPFFTST
jgi:hypothetical protein